MQFDTRTITQHLPELALGVRLTVTLVLLALALGIVFGLVACFGKLLSRGPLYWIASTYVTVMRGIPEMVVMFWIYYCGPLILDTRLSSLTSAVASMSLYAGAFLAEIFRAGILAVPRGQGEAARALAMPEWRTWTDVVLPQALRIMIPAFIGVVTLTVKVSGLASAIGVGELVYQANVIGGQTYRYFELFTAVAMFYFALIFPLSMLAQHYERRLARRMR